MRASLSGQRKSRLPQRGCRRPYVAFVQVHDAQPKWVYGEENFRSEAEPIHLDRAAAEAADEDRPEVVESKPGRKFAKGDQVIVISGSNQGLSGRVFWVGPDKLKKGFWRLGLDCIGEKLWVSAEQVEYKATVDRRERQDK